LTSCERLRVSYGTFRVHERFQELKKIAETQGGMFHDLWVHRNQLHYVNKTNSNKIEEGKENEK
jgi:hypothetical protein